MVSALRPTSTPRVWQVNLVCMLPTHVGHGENGKQETDNVGLSWVLCDIGPPEVVEVEQQEARDEVSLGDKQGVRSEHLEYEEFA